MWSFSIFTSSELNLSKNSFKEICIFEFFVILKNLLKDIFIFINVHIFQISNFNFEGISHYRLLTFIVLIVSRGRDSPEVADDTPPKGISIKYPLQGQFKGQTAKHPSFLATQQQNSISRLYRSDYIPL